MMLVMAITFSLTLSTESLHTLLLAETDTTSTPVEQAMMFYI